jgi:hypothetical protein
MPTEEPDHRGSMRRLSQAGAELALFPDALLDELARDTPAMIIATAAYETMRVAVIGGKNSAPFAGGSMW